MILCRKSFFRNFESKVNAISRHQFLLSSDNSCGTHLLSFWTFPVVCKHTEMACYVTPSSASFFSVCAEFISSNACNTSVSIFWRRLARDSSSRLKSPWRNFWYHLLYIAWFTAFSSCVAQIIAVASAAVFFRWNAKWMKNRICSFVIAIVNTTNFWGYVHQTPNHMTF